MLSGNCPGLSAEIEFLENLIFAKHVTYDSVPSIAKTEVILENAINTRLGFNEVREYSIMISHFYCKILRIFIGKELAPFNYKNAKIYHPCDLVHLQFVHNYLCFSSNYSTSV